MQIKKLLLVVFKIMPFNDKSIYVENNYSNNYFYMIYLNI